MIMNVVRSLLGVAALSAATAVAAPGGAAAGDAYGFTFTSIEGKPMPLDAFKGKALLVVNTASRCGFTKQYEDLQVVWERYRDRGLVVIGVPSNDFGAQEPGGESDIKEFCEVNFGIDFPMTAKVSVTGANAHPFYAWAGQHLGFGAKPRWNFHKYLVDSNGRLVDWFSTMTPPSSPRVVQAIEAALPVRATGLAAEG
jgi:glutathione peroxidase